MLIAKLKVQEGKVNEYFEISDNTGKVRSIKSGNDPSYIWPRSPAFT